MAQHNGQPRLLGESSSLSKELLRGNCRSASPPSLDPSQMLPLKAAPIKALVLPGEPSPGIDTSAAVCSSRGPRRELAGETGALAVAPRDMSA